MTMALLWDRRRLARETQRRTDEQIASVGDQLLEVGEIIGRLNTVAGRFEAVATRIVEACEDDEEKHGNGKDTRPG